MPQRRTVLLALLLIAVAVIWWERRPPEELVPSPTPTPSAPLPTATAPIPQTAPPLPAPAAPPSLAGKRVIRYLPQRAGAPQLARRMVMKRLDLPTRPAIDLYRQLLQAAKGGDATAAFELAMLLGDCHAVPVDEDEVERQIAEVQRTHVNVDTAVRYPAQFAADLRRKYQRCSGLSSAQRASYYDWLKQAADAGQLDALENFELFDPPGDICRQYVFERCPPAQQAASRAARQVIAHYLLAAADAGSLNALWQLGSAYLGGELFEVDNVAAYAHLLAFERASRAFGLDDPVAALVKDLRRKLRPGDLAAAADQARQLLANPRCCVLIQ